MRMLMIFTLLLLVSCSSKQLTVPDESQQLLIVTTKDWNEQYGKLQRYERENGKEWKKVGTPIDVIIGRNGLGWGIGLHKIPKDAKYIKKEGDGKSPAGLFKLGWGFGYGEFQIDFPYAKYERKHHCVDDSNSRYYNTIVDSTKVQRDYKSFEYMRLKNDLYKYGIVVDHNPTRTLYAGSCIFLHIESRSRKGTAGCTAMKEKDIITILKWLKKEKKPLLLQLPIDEIHLFVR